MKKYQREFVEFVIANKALTFGKFKLKSGRISPYFFNAGCVNTGEKIARLGQFYADAIYDANISFDVLFGPAYKGIPLVTSTAISLAEKYKINKPFCFNRKEVKDHGEGGNIVGAKLQGKILFIDDVITAGTAVNESMNLIKAAQAQLAGIVIAMDRQERGQTQLSAIQEVEKKYSVKVISIIKFENLLEFLHEQANMAKELEEMQIYYSYYGLAKS